jgi:L-ribulose-5-phosphate 3-epimerase
MIPWGNRLPVGIYEKAFPSHLSWEERLRLAAEAGYDFVEMSIDESKIRLDRLEWTAGERAELRRASASTGVPILTMGLSAHRRFPLGSASERTRASAGALLRRAIELASDIGIRAIQVMGYDVFYEASGSESEQHFMEGLREGARWAAAGGVMLGLENVDGDFITSVERAMRFVRLVQSPWLQVYPDMGNLVASGMDPIEQLPLAQGHIVGVHVKDAVRGVYRGTPFETGDVPLAAVFDVLARIGFWGPLTVEMWSDLDETGDALTAATSACRLVNRLIGDAWGLEAQMQQADRPAD